MDNFHSPGKKMVVYQVSAQQRLTGGNFKEFLT